jgi:capsular polysaccharide biosynthesis protein
MNQKTETNIPNNNEVDISLFINRINKSKKLIAIVTIISSIIASIYSVSKAPEYQSNALIEIGEYNLFYDDDQLLAKIKINFNSKSYKTLIENQLFLIQDIITNFVHKKNLGISVSPLGEKMLEISRISNSAKDNEDSINLIVTYIQNKHLNITNSLDEYIRGLVEEQIFLLKESNTHYRNIQNQQELNNLERDKENRKIHEENRNNLKNIIADSNNQVLNDNVLYRIIIETSNIQDSLNNFTYTNLIFENSKKIQKLESNLKLIDTRFKTNSELVGKITTVELPKSTSLYLIFGFVFGLFFSIAIVLISNSLKGLKINN